MFTPEISPPVGAVSRAVTSVTAMPDCASPSRFSRSRSASVRKFRKRLLRMLCCEPSDAPWVGGICQRVCWPPGPLKVPRLIMSHMPVAARCWLVPNGLP